VWRFIPSHSLHSWEHVRWLLASLLPHNLATPLALIVSPRLGLWQLWSLTKVRRVGWTTWVASQGSSWVLQRLPDYWPNFHIVNSDKTKQGKKKPLYYCFVDFKKAFSIVSCEVLWQVLVSFGVEGHFLRCLQMMYTKDTIYVNHLSEGVTSSFKCQQGVKQGCPLIPLLFGLYLDAPKGRLDDKKCNTPALADVTCMYGYSILHMTPLWRQSQRWDYSNS
jgi:hypothetical protein